MYMHLYRQLVSREEISFRSISFQICLLVLLRRSKGVKLETTIITTKRRTLIQFRNNMNLTLIFANKFIYLLFQCTY